jgi:cytochrome c oxidase assembly protein subunit 15
MCVGLLLALGTTQGFVGWWMVRSGLKELDTPNKTPRVSPYRSATSFFSLLL